MVTQQPKQKGFFAKYWWMFAGGAVLLGILLVAAAVLTYLFVLKGEAKVTDLSLSSESVEYGKKIEATVTVENDRVLAAEFAGKLTVDGVEKALDEVTVESKESETVKYDLSGLKPGKHTVAIGKLEKEFKILKPAEFEVSGLKIDPAEGVLVGGTLTATATVKNTGEVKGEYEAKFAYDGTEMDPISVTVGPGKEETVTVSVTVPANGAHEISLEGQKQSFTALNPAYITGTELKLSKTFAKPNETITASVRLDNTGDVAGSYSLELFINGKSAARQDVTVEAKSYVTYEYKIKQGKAGTYTLKVGDLSEKLYVVTITRPKTGTLLVKKANGGYGKLTLVNGYKDRDAVFILASTSNPKAPLLTVYMRAGATKSGIKVKDGTYIVYYMTGTNYDSSSKRFITDLNMVRFEDTIRFKTSRSYYRITYSIWTLTINASNGNDQPIDVDDADFPR